MRAEYLCILVILNKTKDEGPLNVFFIHHLLNGSGYNKK